MCVWPWQESIEELRSNLIRMQRDLEASLAETAKYKKMLDESEEQNKSLRKVVRLYEAEKFAHSVDLLAFTVKPPPFA